jgi:hypothetical protein
LHLRAQTERRTRAVAAINCSPVDGITGLRQRFGSAEQERHDNAGQEERNVYPRQHKSKNALVFTMGLLGFSLTGYRSK